ncbi:hypothetical protein MJ575_13650 [Klebsiella pneumoniae]|nr:hypothetical protein MJ575_13650 [Klebsiella pneumoniae]
MEHLVNDLLHCRLQGVDLSGGHRGPLAGRERLQLLPTAPCGAGAILSAGVHGNETAPIELLLRNPRSQAGAAAAPRRRC